MLPKGEASLTGRVYIVGRAALCALHVGTTHRSCPTATDLEYALRDGNLSHTNPIAHSVIDTMHSHGYVSNLDIEKAPRRYALGLLLKLIQL